MNLRLFYDTETTGIPDWSNPSDAPHQPHLVELAAIAVCPNTREIVHSMSVIVRPDGWAIPADTTAIHGITTERALDVGIPEAEAVSMLLVMAGACDRRVGFSEQFDARMLRIALKRYRPEHVDPWKAFPAECAMRQTQKAFGGKWSTLGDAYQRACGKTLEGAHSAYADTVATAALYWALQPLLPAA